MNLLELGKYKELEEKIFDCRKCEQICEDRNKFKYHFPQSGTLPRLGIKTLIVATNPGMPHTGESRIEKFKHCHLLYDLAIKHKWRGGIKIFNLLGIDWETTLFTNIIKCATENNRIPTFDEIKNCFPFLMRQLNLIKPKLVICLGAVSSSVFLRRNEVSLREVNGKVFKSTKDSSVFHIIPLYHPSYVWRQDFFYREEMFKRFRKLKFRIRRILDEEK